METEIKYKGGWFNSPEGQRIKAILQGKESITDAHLSLTYLEFVNHDKDTCKICQSLRNNGSI